MISLSDYVKKNVSAFMDLAVEQGENVEFFQTRILAKVNTARNQNTLEFHTKSALNELKTYINENKEVVANFSSRNNIKLDILLDILFFSVFLHDLGKGTIEFYDDKILDKGSSYHPLYSIYFTINQEDLPKIEGIDYITLSILSHHTVIHEDIYGSENFKDLPVPGFFKETVKFAKQYREYYFEFFQKDCPYNLNFELSEKLPYRLLREKIGWGPKQGLLDNLNKLLGLANHNEKKKMKEAYGFVTGNLIRADWLSSGSYNLDFPDINKEKFVHELKKLSGKKGIKFEGLKEFQQESSELTDNLLIKIPTGEGKTEAALLWAINNLKNKYTRIIYTMPTQVTSNAMYKRLKSYFGDKNVGIVHGAASIILNEEYKEDKERIWKERAVSRTFSKPITVATLDSFILSFFNVHKWPLAQLNLENCLLIIDEIHSYDWQMLGAIKRIFRELKVRNCKIVIMSATFPEILEEVLLEDVLYEHVTQAELFKPRPSILKLENRNISNKIDTVLDYFDKNKKILIVVNTVEKSKELYKLLKNTGKFITSEDSTKDTNLLLYHAQFIKKDRKTKENEIEEKDGWKNRGLILIATQIVEISLDINFEILFTEIAPVDSLVQRMGRINRRKDTEKLGEVFIQTDIDSRNKKGEWSYPYSKNVIDCSKDILKEGNPSLGTLANWVSILYEKLLKIDDVHFEFENKFNKGFKKYDIIIEKGPYTLRFSTDNAKEIAKILKLRDIDERFEKIDVIPKVIFEESDDDDFKKYENTVGIYKWLFRKMEKEGNIDIMDKFYLLHGVKYDYECGLRIIENEDWKFQ